MILLSDISAINQDLRTGFDRDAFAQFMLRDLGLRLEDYASTNNFITQLTECLSRLKLEGRLPELLIKASVFRPTNEVLKKWSEKASIIERAKKNPKSIVTLGGSRIFIGRDDLKQKISKNLKNRQSWVIQLQGNQPKSGVSHCYWYIKHRASLLEDVDVKEINLKKINEEEEVPVTPYHLATAIIDKLNLDMELPEDGRDDNFKKNRFLNRFIGIVSEQKTSRYLLFIDQFRDAQITEDTKGFIKGLVAATRELDNLAIITSINESFNPNELQQLDIVKIDSFSEAELRDFLKSLYEELPILTGSPNDVSEQEFIDNGMAFLSDELAKLPNVEALGATAMDFFSAVQQAAPNDYDV